MAVKRYNVTLDPVVVKRAKKRVFGAKLSPIINGLLRIWIEFPEEVDKLLHKLKEDNKKT